MCQSGIALREKRPESFAVIGAMATSDPHKITDSLIPFLGGWRRASTISMSVSLSCCRDNIRNVGMLGGLPNSRIYSRGAMGASYRNYFRESDSGMGRWTLFGGRAPSLKALILQKPIL
jgi:hypothetical protein